MSSSDKTKLHQEKTILIGFFVLVAVVIGAIAYVNFLRDKATQTILPAKAPLSVLDGDKKADAKVVVYTDPLCEKCVEFHNDILKKVRKEYVETNKIALEVRPLSIVSDQSAGITELLMCSDEQGKYWQVADIAYASIWSKNGKTPEENAASIYSNYPVAKIAQQTGADASRLDACIKEGAYAAKISQADAQAYGANIYSTPITFIGEQSPVRGYANYEYISSLIDINR